MHNIRGKLAALLSLAAAAIVCSLAAPAQAVPILQLYVEGAEYNTETESWDFTSEDGTANVWVIANTGSPSSKGTVFDVNLVVAYDAQNTEAAVSLLGSDPVGDPLSGTGTSPTVQDGSQLPAHGVYGEDTTWQQFSLGNFEETSDPLADFDEDFDVASLAEAKLGSDTEVYAITLENITGSVHLDAFGYTANADGDMELVWTAPFSHDANIHTSVPELSAEGAAPALALLVGGVLILVGKRRRRAAK
jgi:hypothetical protein